MSAQYKDGKYYGTGASPMPAEDMSSVASPLPSVMSRRFKYSTEEQIVGEWIDGKPLYQKTFTTNVSCTTQANAGSNFYYGNIDVSSIIPNIDMAFPDRDFSYYNPVSGTATRSFVYMEWTSELAGLFLMTLFSRLNVPATITLQYTKTTD